MKTQRKILIATFGSLGDLHPFVALAHALVREGFAPVIGTSAGYADYIRGEGLAFAPVRPDAEDLTARLGVDLGEIARRMTEDDAYLFDTLIFPHLRESYDDLLAASEGAVAIVAHALAFSGRLVAETRGLPLINILLSPMMLYSAYDPPQALSAPIRRAPVWPAEIVFNRFVIWSLSHAVALWAAPLRRLRRELGLPRRHGLDLLLGVNASMATIGLFSPTLAPPQPDHGARTLVAGHTFHDRYLGEASLSGALGEFLARGDPPVVFTLGSFVARQRHDHYRACVEAARRVGRRAVLLVHDEDQETIAAGAGPDVHVAAYAPHSLIFPRACAVVHHGGVGTTGQALRAGRPQIVTPFFGDQYDNGERVARLGVARVVKSEELTVDGLARQLEDMLCDTSASEAAAALAAIVAKEDGGAVAAARVRNLLGAELIGQRQGLAE